MPELELISNVLLCFIHRAGTREVHNKLEKNRRAHLKGCYEVLKHELPLNDEDRKKTSNLTILDKALKCVLVRQYIHTYIYFDLYLKYAIFLSVFHLGTDKVRSATGGGDGTPCQAKN